MSHLPPTRIGDEIPLESLSARSPGAFVLRGDDLRWRPASGVSAPARCTVILVDAAGRDLSWVLERQRSTEEGELRYLVSGMASPPAFARVTSPESSDSALAIITRLDELVEEIREVGSRSAERLRERLELGTHTEATLELLRLIDELEADGRDRPALGQAISIPKPQSEGEQPTPASAYRQMSYEEFMAHRRPYREGSRPPASFAGTDLSLVRGVLNRIAGTGLGASNTPTDADDGATMLAAFDLGDETAVQGEFDTDAGGDVRRTSQQCRTSRVTKAATAQEIADAVSNFATTVRIKRERGELSATDLLRLRALLMVVCWAALPCSASVGRPSDLQVLQMAGTEPTWWRTVGRVLYALFRRTDSARQQIRQHIGPLAERVYRLTMLTRDELLGGVVRETMDRMCERLAERLAVDPGAVAAGHENMAARFAGSSPTVE